MMSLEEYTEKVKKNPRFWELVEIVKEYKTYGQVAAFLDGTRRMSDEHYAIAREMVRCAFGY